MQIIYAISASAVVDGIISTSDLVDGSVTTPKLGAAAVTTAKLAAGAVTGSKIATDSLRILGFTGLASSGDITLSVDPGDVVIQVLDADNFPYGASFDSPVIAPNVFRQNENSDFSAKAFVAFILRRTP